MPRIDRPGPKPLAFAFEAVSKRYGGPSRPVALADLTLAVPAGQAVAVLGPNRAGKTTLAKLLLTLCRPNAGRIERLGRPADDRSTLARVGYVHERPAFPPELTASQLLRSYAVLTGLARAERRRRVPELLERVGLADRDREPIGRFSKGMVQRLALAQALLNRPELLVLDEPAEGLDLTGRRLVADVVREQARLGRTTLLITHNLALAQPLADRLVVLKAGRLAFDGPPAALGDDGPARRREDALLRLFEAPSPC